MIKSAPRYDRNATRHPLDPSKEIMESGVKMGQLLTKNDSGKAIIAGAGAIKVYVAQGSKEVGRDTITPTGVLTGMDGKMEISIDQYDKSGTYAAGTTLLKAGADGLVTDWNATDDADKQEFIIGKAIGAPSTDGYLIVSLDI